MPTTSTSTSSSSAAADKLSRCKQQFELWRKQQALKTGKPVIPNSLWKEAIKLIPEFSISRISQELRLNQARLRLKQIELGSSQKAKQKSKQSTEFLQLQHPITFPTQSTAVSDLRFSIQKADGSHLRVALPTSQDKLAEILFNSFLQA
jgi:hypothetical protein